MIFLINLGVTGILCRFRLDIEGKAGRLITVSSILDFLVTSSANNFVLSEAEDNNSRLLNRESIAGLPLLRTKVTNAKFL